MRKLLLAVLMMLVFSVAASAESYYVSTTGSPSGAGTIDDPWDIETALEDGGNPADTIQPGDTVWFRGGTYEGKFTCDLDGTSTARITFRTYPGERAAIDLGAGDGAAVTVNGDWTTWDGLEMFSSATGRYHDSSVADDYRGEGINVFGANTRLVNLNIHDTQDAIGLWGQAVNSTIEGCKLWNNGHLNNVRGNGHGIYSQTAQTNDARLVRDVLSWSNFSTGMKAYTDAGYVSDFTFDGVISFNNGAPGALYGISAQLATEHYENIFVGTITNPTGTVCLRDCYTYHPDGFTGPVTLGYTAAGTSLSVTGCYFANGVQGLATNHWRSATITGNTIYSRFVSSGSGIDNFILKGDSDADADIANWTVDHNVYYDKTYQQDSVSHPFTFNSVLNGSGGGRLSFNEWKAGTPFDDNSTYSTSDPTTNSVFVRPLRTARGTAHVAVYNWEGLSSVEVPLGETLRPGDAYEVVLAERMFETPVATGVYNGTSIMVPMTSPGDPTPPINYVDTNDEPLISPETLPEFGAFIVRPLRETVTVPPDPDPDPDPDPEGIAVDSTSVDNFYDVSSGTFAHTVGSGSNRLLIVGVSVWHWQYAPTAITYNGDALTKMTPQPGHDGNEQTVQMWYLVNPDVGTHDIEVTFNPSPPDFAFATVGAVSLTGVDQSTPIGTFTSATGTTEARTLNVSSEVGDLVVSTVVWGGGTNDITLGSGGTEAWLYGPSTPGSASDEQWGAGMTKPGKAGTTAMSYTFDETNWFSTICGVAVKPAP